jgi:DNA-binding GntR family transcriptional regulator
MGAGAVDVGEASGLTIERNADGVAVSRSSARMRTLPEQIADDLGVAIAEGVYKPGERLLEIEISNAYGVSRGPVREAIRMLAQRGLAVFYPRRGAFVLELNLDRVVDIFNTRAVLLGLAARYFALMAPPAAHARLAEALEALRVLGDSDACDPIAFAYENGRAVRIISMNCGSDSLHQLLTTQVESSAWGTLWRRVPPDFRTRERRVRTADDYIELGRILAAGDGDRADLKMRSILHAVRDVSVASLSENRGETYDKRRLLVV